MIVRAPRGVGVREISAFVRRHARWIEKRRAALAAAPVPDFTDGAILTLYGRRYTVAAGRTRIGGDTVYLPAEGQERALAALLKRLAKDYMGNLTAIYAERYGFSYQSVRITSARGRWGSCNAHFRARAVGVVQRKRRNCLFFPHGVFKRGAGALRRRT